MNSFLIIFMDLSSAILFEQKPNGTHTRMKCERAITHRFQLWSFLSWMTIALLQIVWLNAIIRFQFSDTDTKEISCNQNYRGVPNRKSTTENTTKEQIYLVYR